jgi:hypothetical protein
MDSKASFVESTRFSGTLSRGGSSHLSIEQAFEFPLSDNPERVTESCDAASCRSALGLGAPSLLRCVIDPELSEYGRENAVATLLNIESAEIDQLLTRARV